MTNAETVKVNRLMIAGMTSGSGKTTLTCAFLRCLQKKGLDLKSYKCGPDYIDPMFHKKAFGIESRNLDIFFMGEERLRASIAKARDSYAVIEGVMGIYDGNDVSSVAGSCYEIASVTSTPIVLVVNAGKVGRTIISMIRGVIGDDEGKLIKGIILNNITGKFYGMLAPELEKALSVSRPDVKLLGFFPKTKGIDFESRHLGLKLPDESAETEKKIETASEVFEENADIDAMIGIMRSADELIIPKASVADAAPDDGLTLAVAYDDAFCFYYRDNLDMFEERGVKIKYFSPLYDSAVPEDADGLLLGGGYPELYLEKLSQNRSMLSSIKALIDRRIPSLAECGGFMYLGRSIEDDKGNVYETVGAYEGKCRFSGKLVRFGYMQIIEAPEDLLCGSMKGLKGHEFHYYDSDMNGEACIAGKPFRDITWKCIVSDKNGIWGFPHFYYGSDPAFVDSFVRKMKEVKDGKLE
ncbi:MAG: cobyrinate a,c-diamide synthase [Lachnospiraceae bacterium]|nr:cobyrinate a,c-diamide synthase [Lachnospiraceae bacterium]